MSAVTAAAPRTVLFDGHRFRVAVLRAQVAAERGHCPDTRDWELLRTALITLSARRKHGRSAWIYTTRLDSWDADGSAHVYEVTVGFGGTRRSAGPCVDCARTWVRVREDELRTAASALGVTPPASAARAG